MSGIKKTDRDMKREAIAHEINGNLIGQGISVIGGGSKGPYTIVIERLSEVKMRQLLAKLTEVKA